MHATGTDLANRDDDLRLVTLPDAARFLSVSRGSLYDLLTTGQLADFVDVDRGAAHHSDASIQIEILPTEPECFRDAPTLHEQQPDDSAEAIVRRRPDQVACSSLLPPTVNREQPGSNAASWLGISLVTENEAPELGPRMT